MQIPWYIKELIERANIPGALNYSTAVKGAHTDMNAPLFTYEREGLRVCNRGGVT